MADLEDLPYLLARRLGLEVPKRSVALQRLRGFAMGALVGLGLVFVVFLWMEVLHG